MRPQAQPEPRRADEPSSAGGRRARTALATVVFRATKAARPVRRCLRRGPARPRSGSCRWSAKAAYQVALATPAARTFATALRSFLAAAPAGPLEEVDGDRGPGP